ncbi:hypothetical protein MTP99_017391 [Tenebrio molitor]|nr:hypothetical protein MTP99_017391 [Tenebrio molitor]
MHLVQYAAKESETLRMVGIVRNDVIIECISGTLVELVNEENGFETLTSAIRSERNQHPLSRVGILKDDVVTECTSGTLVDLLNRENGFETLISSAKNSTKTHPLSSVKLPPPITQPDKVLCIGMNYQEHCDELKIPHPVHPIVFNKFASTPSITSPNRLSALDWEMELVAVVGKRAKQVWVEEAYDYVLGYSVGQDLTARDWVTGEKLWTLCPLGPCVVPKDAIADLHSLQLKKQNGVTSRMVHRIDKLITHLSSFMTLYPGDVTMSGTPSGVGFFRMKPCTQEIYSRAKSTALGEQ